MPVATEDDVARLAQRELTEPEKVFAIEGIAALTATIERLKNRVLYPREITETVRVGNDGLLNPTKGPVTALLSASVDGNEYAGVWLTQWYGGGWPVGYEVEITYMAGTAPDEGLRDTIAGAVARTLLTPAVVALGVVGSYSVEGTSITYRTSEQGEGGLLVGELKGLGRLRRPVLL